MSADSGSDQSKEARRSDELASRLAYEGGWQLCEHAVQTLEAQRTRAIALLSVTLVSAGIAASAFLAGGIAEDLGWVGSLGGGVFVVSALAVTVTTATVAWPVEMDVLDPEQLVEKYSESQHPDRKPVWVYKSLARDLAEAHATFMTTLRRRNKFYKWSVGCAPTVIAGAGMVVLDAIV